MTESTRDPISPELEEAFAQAVWAYDEFWHPENEGRLIQVKGRSGDFQIIEICGFVEQFVDPLPDQVFAKLYSYLHDYPDGDLKRLLGGDATYRGGGKCLRTKIEREKAEYQRREESRRNR